MSGEVLRFIKWTFVMVMGVDLFRWSLTSTRFSLDFIKIQSPADRALLHMLGARIISSRAMHDLAARINLDLTDSRALPE